MKKNNTLKTKLEYYFSSTCGILCYLFSMFRARFQLSSGPGSQGTIAAQFNCEGTTLSGVEFELVGSGYRVSLVKRRFVSGNIAIVYHEYHVSRIQYKLSIFIRKLCFSFSRNSYNIKSLSFVFDRFLVSYPFHC